MNGTMSKIAQGKNDRDERGGDREFVMRENKKQK